MFIYSKVSVNQNDKYDKQSKILEQNNQQPAKNYDKKS